MIEAVGLERMLLSTGVGSWKVLRNEEQLFQGTYVAVGSFWQVL